jgi:hypothetical protein
MNNEWCFEYVHEIRIEQVLSLLDFLYAEMVLLYCDGTASGMVLGWKNSCILLSISAILNLIVLIYKGDFYGTQYFVF